MFGRKKWVPELTPIEFYILYTLRDRDSYGNEMYQTVARLTETELILVPGTLYAALNRMSSTTHGWIEEIGEKSADERLRYYRITEKGRQMLENEFARLKRVSKLDRKKL